MKLSLVAISSLFALVSARNVVNLQGFQGFENRQQLDTRDKREQAEEPEIPVRHIRKGGQRRRPLKNTQFVQEDGKEFVMIPGDEQPQAGPLLLKTALSVASDIDIFSGYLRDIPEFQKAVDDSKSYMIILAPCDEAIRSMEVKPYEFPRSLTGSEEDVDRNIALNIYEFCSHHVISSRNEGQTLAGDAVELKKDVVSVAGATADVISVQKVENGEIWIIGSFN